MLSRPHLMIVATLEGLVMASAILRTAFPPGLDFGSPPQLAWFLGTVLLAGASIAHFVVRSSMLAPRVKAGESADDDRKQIFVISIAMVIGAGLLSAAGPGTFVKLLGS